MWTFRTLFLGTGLSVFSAVLATIYTFKPQASRQRDTSNSPDAHLLFRMQVYRSYFVSSSPTSLAKAWLVGITIPCHILCIAYDNCPYSSYPYERLVQIPQPRPLQHQRSFMRIYPVASLITNPLAEHTAIVIMASTASSVAIAMEVIAAIGTQCCTYNYYAADISVGCRPLLQREAERGGSHLPDLCEPDAGVRHGGHTYVFSAGFLGGRLM